MSEYGSFNIKGAEDLQKAILEKYSGAKSTGIINSAVYEGTEVFAEDLQKNIGTFKDTGAERDEIVVRKTRKTADGYIAKVGWNGPKSRYRIVHLNEFGYNRKGKQYTPKGFGVIAKTISQSSGKYFKIVEGKMREML